MPRSDAETRRLARRVVLRVDRYFADFGRRFEASVRPGLGELADRFATKDVSTEIEAAVRLLVRTFGWNAETRRFLSFVGPALELVGGGAVEAVGAELGIDVSFDLFARKPLLDDVATRVVGISDTSRTRLASLIGDGLSKGLSIEQIVRGVPPGSSNIRGEIPAFAGIRGLVDSWLSTGTGRILGPGVSATGSRSYLVALTETAMAWNTSAIATYRGAGIGFVEVFDGDDCGWTSHNDPDLAARSIRTVDEAKAHPIAHPRCQRAFGAAVNASSTRPSPLARAAAPEAPGRPEYLDAVEAAERDGYGATWGSVKSRAVEYGADFRIDGTPLGGVSKGASASVGVSDEAWALLQQGRGAEVIVSHSHPYDTILGVSGELRSFARGFSAGDLEIAIRHDLAEMRAVTDLFVHRLVRPSGGYPKALAKEISGAYKKLSDALAEETYAARAAAKAAGEPFVWRDNMHEALVRIAKEYGLTYERVAR